MLTIWWGSSFESIIGLYTPLFPAQAPTRFYTYFQRIFNILIFADFKMLLWPPPNSQMQSSSRVRHFIFYTYFLYIFNISIMPIIHNSLRRVPAVSHTPYFMTKNNAALIHAYAHVCSRLLVRMYARACVYSHRSMWDMKPAAHAARIRRRRRRRKVWRTDPALACAALASCL